MSRFQRFQTLYNIAQSRRAREASNFFLYEFTHDVLTGGLVQIGPNAFLRMVR